MQQVQEIKQTILSMFYYTKLKKIYKMLQKHFIITIAEIDKLNKISFELFYECVYNSN